MGDGVCLPCGRWRRADDHHVGGEANNPEATIPAGQRCCHPIFNRRQLDAGALLDHDAPRTDLDRRRATIIGVFDLGAVFWRRTCTCLVPLAEAVETAAQAASMLMDLTGDPDRAGRFLPDTIGARHRKPRPVRMIRPDPKTDEPRALSLLQLLGVLGLGTLELTRDEAATVATLTRSIPTVMKRLKRAMGDPDVKQAWQGLPQRLRLYLEDFNGFMVQLIKAITTGEGDEERMIARVPVLGPVLRSVPEALRLLITEEDPERHRQALLLLPKALTAWEQRR
jgi:hypothetical protein